MGDLQRRATEVDTQARNHAADAERCDRLTNQAALARSQYDAWKAGQTMNLSVNFDGEHRQPFWYTGESLLGTWGRLPRPSDAGPTMLAACERRIAALAAQGAKADDHRSEAARCASEAAELRRQAEALHLRKLEPLSVALD
jgi:hypothetical protein